MSSDSDSSSSDNMSELTIDEPLSDAEENATPGIIGEEAGDELQGQDDEDDDSIDEDSDEDISSSENETTNDVKSKERNLDPLSDSNGKDAQTGRISKALSTEKRLTPEEKLGQTTRGRERITKMHVTGKEVTRKATDLMTFDLGKSDKLPMLKTYDPERDHEWLLAGQDETIYAQYEQSDDYKEIRGKVPHSIKTKKLWYIQAEDQSIIERLNGKSMPLSQLENMYNVFKEGSASCHMVLTPLGKREGKWKAQEFSRVLSLVSRQSAIPVPEIDIDKVQMLGVGSGIVESNTSSKLVSPKPPIGSGPTHPLRAEKVRNEELVSVKPPSTKKSKESKTPQRETKKPKSSTNSQSRKQHKSKKDQKRKRKDSDGSTKKKKAKRA